MNMLKNLGLISIGLISGITLTSIFYEDYIDKFYESFLSKEYEELTYGSREAFWDLDPVSSRFVQMKYLLFIYRAQKGNMIADESHNKLAALFTTRACINYEDENNVNLSEKMCKLAQDDYTIWKGDDKFTDFKNSLIMERAKVLETRESNNTNQPTAESGG